VKQFYSLPEVCTALGEPYHRVWYAVINRIVEPMKSGRSRIFTRDDLMILRRHFAEREVKPC
jgi:hypothetical protein